MNSFFAVTAPGLEVLAAQELQHLGLLPDAAFACDSRGTVLATNPAAKSLFNWRIRDMLGKPALELFADDHEILRNRWELSHAELDVEIQGRLGKERHHD